MFLDSNIIPLARVTGSVRDAGSINSGVCESSQITILFQGEGVMAEKVKGTPSKVCQLKSEQGQDKWYLLKRRGGKQTRVVPVDTPALDGKLVPSADIDESTLKAYDEYLNPQGQTEAKDELPANAEAPVENGAPEGQATKVAVVH